MATRNKNVAAYRNRMKRSGLVRLEVKVRKQDVPLVRRVVDALSDPAQEREARTLLRERFVEHAARGLKELLAAAPLEGIDLKRVKDTGRPVDL